LVLLVVGVVTVALVRRDSTSSVASGHAAQGSRIVGDGYSFGPPAGWRDQPQLHRLFSGSGGAEVLQVLAGSVDPGQLSQGGYVSIVRARTAGPVNLEQSVRAFITGISSGGVEARLRGTPGLVGPAGARAGAVWVSAA